MSQLRAMATTWQHCNREPWQQPKKSAKQSFPPTWPAVLMGFNPLQSLQSEQETIHYNDNEITPSLDSKMTEIRRQHKYNSLNLRHQMKSNIPGRKEILEICQSKKTHLHQKKINHRECTNNTKLLKQADHRR